MLLNDDRIGDWEIEASDREFELLSDTERRCSFAKAKSKFKVDSAEEFKEESERSATLLKPRRRFGKDDLSFKTSQKFPPTF